MQQVLEVSVSNLNYDILNEIENLLKSFKFISVRDFNSQNFLKINLIFHQR